MTYYFSKPVNGYHFHYILETGTNCCFMAPLWPLHRRRIIPLLRRGAVIAAGWSQTPKRHVLDVYSLTADS